MDIANRVFIVATDLTGRTTDVLLRALVLAKACNAELRVIHVVAAEVYARRRAEGLRAGLAHNQDPRDEMLAILQQDLNEALAQGVAADLPTSTSVLLGEPSQVILREARSTDAGLVVLGPHAPDFFADHLFGATSQHILRNGRWPVLVVKRGSARPYRRVLIATDFSRHAQGAMAVAAALGKTAHFDLLHVTTASQMQSTGTVSTAEMLSRSEEKTSSTALQTRMLEIGSRIGIPSRRMACHLADGDPGEAILMKARELDVDLVAVGSRGANPVMQLLLGTVSQQVVRASDCDTLIVRVPEAGN